MLALIGVELSAHRRRRPMQSRLDGASRHAKGLACLLVREPEIVVQDDHDTVLGLDPAEHAVDLIPIRELAG